MCLFRYTALFPTILKNNGDFWTKSHIRRLYVAAQSLCSSGEISKNPSWKLENVVSTIYKIVSNFVFSNCLQMRTYLQFCSLWMAYWLKKMTISVSVWKIHFPKIKPSSITLNQRSHYGVTLCVCQRLIIHTYLLQPIILQVTSLIFNCTKSIQYLTFNS